MLFAFFLLTLEKKFCGFGRFPQTQIESRVQYHLTVPIKLLCSCIDWSTCYGTTNGTVSLESSNCQWLWFVFSYQCSGRCCPCGSSCFKVIKREVSEHFINTRLPSYLLNRIKTLLLFITPWCSDNTCFKKGCCKHDLIRISFQHSS